MVDWAKLYSEHRVDRSVPAPARLTWFQRLHRTAKEIEPWSILLAAIGLIVSGQ